MLRYHPKTRRGFRSFVGAFLVVLVGIVLLAGQANAAPSGSGVSSLLGNPTAKASHPVSAKAVVANLGSPDATLTTAGGTWNPGAVGMEKMLNGAVDAQTAAVDPVVTPEQFGIATTSPEDLQKGQMDMTFDASRDVGADNMADAIEANVNNGEDVTALVYSQSASFSPETKQDLAARGVSPEMVEFIELGSPRGPNGIETKFAGLSVGGVTMKGQAPDSQYHTTQVTREYGLYEDVPDKLNLASIWNWGSGGLEAHGSYENVDYNGARAYSEGNTDYVLLKNDNLAIARDLRNMGVNVTPEMEQGLRDMVDAGYDRSKYDAPQNAPVETAPAPEPAPVESAPVAPAMEQVFEPVYEAVEQYFEPQQAAAPVYEQSYQAPVQQVAQAVNDFTAQAAPQLAPAVNNAVNGIANALGVQLP